MVLSNAIVLQQRKEGVDHNMAIVTLGADPQLISFDRHLIMPSDLRTELASWIGHTPVLAILIFLVLPYTYSTLSLEILENWSEGRQ